MTVSSFCKLAQNVTDIACNDDETAMMVVEGRANGAREVVILARISCRHSLKYLQYEFGRRGHAKGDREDEESSDEDDEDGDDEDDDDEDDVNSLFYDDDMDG